MASSSRLQRIDAWNFIVLWSRIHFIELRSNYIDWFIERTLLTPILAPWSLFLLANPFDEIWKSSTLSTFASLSFTLKWWLFSKIISFLWKNISTCETCYIPNSFVDRMHKKNANYPHVLLYICVFLLFRMNSIFRLPSHNRYSELTDYIEKSPIKDIEVLYHKLIAEIFSSTSQFYWGLRTLRSDTNHSAFQAIYNFLSPNGAIFRLCYRLLDCHLLFEFPYQYLPVSIKWTLSVYWTHLYVT